MYRIEEINLEYNKLGDKATSILLEALTENKSLKKLNISNNYLTNTIGSYIYQVLSKNYVIQELYLHWNQINASGGILIIKGLLENESLKVLDLSWNSLGGDEESCVPVIQELFKKNDVLIHFDLSNNYFTLEESRDIAKGLELPNYWKRIYLGNYGYVDSRGFLVFDESNLQRDVISNLQRIQSCKSIKNLNRKHGEPLKNSCWICEGWQEVAFKWIPNVSGDISEPPIYLHLDFEEYSGYYIGRLSKRKQHFQSKRIVPPGKLIFFWTTGETQTTAKNYEKIEMTDKILKNVTIQGKSCDLSVETRNILELSKNTELIHQYGLYPTVLTKPRQRGKLFLKQKGKRKWTFPISVFKDYRKDNEEVLKKCFEFDWDCSRIPRKIKSEEDQEKTKEILEKFYKRLKQTYKYYSSLNPVLDTWAISQFYFYDLIEKTKIIDNKLIKKENVVIKHAETLSGKDHKGQRNPPNACVRFQLMETFVRIAEEKYIVSGVCDNFAEAVGKLIEEHLEGHFNEFDSQAWRDARYWNEECDDLLKFYAKVLENLYERNSMKKCLPGQKPFMCLDEFLDIVKKANVFCENCGEQYALM